MGVSATVILLGLALAGLAGAVGYLVGQHRSRDLTTENAALKATLEAERQAERERRATLEQTQGEFSQLFANLSNKALQDNNKQFLALAQEKMAQFNIQSKGELEKREQAVEAMIKPIREILDKTAEQMQTMERNRVETHTAISKHLESLIASQQMLQGETRNLVQALRRPEVRGQWGELTLKRLVELAGMVNHCDFYEQTHVTGESGAIRPDMIIRMPGERIVIVDVKTPLDAYLSATEAADETRRQEQLNRHAKKVRERVQELAGKAYWQQFEQSPDFVVLFIPGEHFLSAALERDTSLLEDALAKKVILATPTSLVALLRAVAFGWNQQAVTENARDIQRLGAELYKRLLTFTGHIAKLGKSLGSSLDSYNNAVGSFERNVLSGARKFTELGIQSKTEIDSLEPLDKMARAPAVSAADALPEEATADAAPSDEG
ncbi:MAG: DNA recombination protein RmuC [Gammaproteobacteria bacterium]|nr:DNA recombination protein RmuC [Gammaproteobacteria bacterium]